MKTYSTSKNKLILFIISVFFVNAELNSQEFLRGFGVRIGGYSAYQGLSYKEFLTPSLSMESVIGKNTGSDARNVSLQVIFQHNMYFKKTDRISCYVGAGPKMFYWYRGNGTTSRDNLYLEKDTKCKYALNALFGLQAKIGQFPLSISIDCGPSFFIFPYTKTNLMLNSSLFYTIKNTKFTAHTHLSKSSYSKNRSRF